MLTPKEAICGATLLACLLYAAVKANNNDYDFIEPIVFEPVFEWECE